jgi:EamA-like transporter family.
MYAGLFALALAYVLWYHGVEKLGNSMTAAYSNPVPVWTLIAAWIWTGREALRTTAFSEQTAFCIGTYRALCLGTMPPS